MMKKKVMIVLAGLTAAASLFGCSKGTGDTAQGSGGAQNGFDASSEITVVSREDGSGTRGAFVELLGIEEKDASGNKVDHTTEEAVIASKTDVMLTQVAGNETAIGYVSLGSLNNSVTALKVDGVEATAENVKNGSYAVARPFNIATKGEPTGLTKDFIDFILSKEGQAIVSEGYIAINDSAPDFAGTLPAGKIVIAGSSSVTPIMEKLVEAYQKLNNGAQIEVQMSDSSSGMTSAADGTCDIGMASRALKDSEKETLTDCQIALDGIAVIVNPKNTATDLSADQIKSIFTGKSTAWSDVK